MFVYVGCYTEPSFGAGEGISVFRFDAGSGGLSLVQTVTGVANPSYLASSADGRHLYAVEELDEGAVTAFARDPETGRLTFLNRQSSEGAAPCHASLDPSGRYALVANYGSGSVAALPIAADGRIGPATGVVQHAGSSVHPERQEGPHAHMVVSSPARDGRLVLATDLGTDRIMVYRLDDATGRLLPNDRGPAYAEAARGDGPRHVAFARTAAPSTFSTSSRPP
jgi:6-phosphogluconolactonase